MVALAWMPCYLSSRLLLVRMTMQSLHSLQGPPIARLSAPFSLPCAFAASSSTPCFGSCFLVLSSAGFTLCSQKGLFFSLAASCWFVLSVSGSGQPLLIAADGLVLLLPRSLSLASSPLVVALLLVPCPGALPGRSALTHFLSPFSHRPSTPT